MSRTLKSAKTIGTAFERGIADYLAIELFDDTIDRRARNGQKDRGDIAGVHTTHGHRLVIEAKNCTRQELPDWTRQAHREAGNDDALAGVVIHKRHGTTHVGKQWVTMTVDDLLALLSGQRHGHRKDVIA